MVARIFYSEPEGGYSELSGRIARTGWELREQAEEGSTPISTLVFDDPLMDLDLTGHRQVYVIEDESEVDDDVLFAGTVADQGFARTGGDFHEPLARALSISLTDRNAYWQRRVMVGADCKRPAESDVARMQWLLSTSEAGWADDVTTYVSTASPANMDKNDYRGQTFSQIADDCAQATGKNWYSWLERDGDGDLQVMVWYGKDTLAARSSDLRLSNDLDDLDPAAIDAGTATVWPLGADTRLNRDPGRVYTGVYLRYDNGRKAIYRRNADAVDIYGVRDMIADYPNVRTKTKAEARATRLLNDLEDQHHVISTTVLVPRGKATMIRAGMRIPVRATHLPGYEGWTWLRILSCVVSPVASGERYRLSLEMVPTDVAWTPPIVPGEGEFAQAALFSPDNPDHLDLVWNAPGYDPPGGYSPYCEPSEFFTYNLDGPSGKWRSITVNGTGYCTVYVKFSAIGVWSAGTTAITFTLIAGSASEQQEFSKTWAGLFGATWTAEMTISDVLLGPGDLIVADYSVSRGGVTIPAGAGSPGFKLYVSGYMS